MTPIRLPTRVLRTLHLVIVAIMLALRLCWRRHMRSFGMPSTCMPTCSRVTCLLLFRRSAVLWLMDGLIDISQLPRVVSCMLLVMRRPQGMVVGKTVMARSRQIWIGRAPPSPLPE